MTNLAALIKELLLDLADNKVVRHDTARLIESGHSVAWEYLPGWEDQCIAKCDVEVSLRYLVRTEQVDRRDIMTLNQFLAGASIAEIESITHDARARINKVLALLEDATKYTDDRFLERVVTKYPKFVKTKEAYREKLVEYGRSFE